MEPVESALMSSSLCAGETMKTRLKTHESEEEEEELGGEGEVGLINGGVIPCFSSAVCLTLRGRSQGLWIFSRELTNQILPVLPVYANVLF